MDSLVAAIAQHGYTILFAFVFLEVIGFPVPAAPVLLVAGGASVHGPLQPAASLLTALSALLLGDALMYTMGKYTGWWLLGVLCRLWQIWSHALSPVGSGPTNFLCLSPHASLPASG